jgi:hypothetical protein
MPPIPPLPHHHPINPLTLRPQGLKPKAVIRGWEFVAVDPFEQLLLGESPFSHAYRTYLSTAVASPRFPPCSHAAGILGSCVRVYVCVCVCVFLNWMCPSGSMLALVWSVWELMPCACVCV